jgi:hypothetical protein
MKNLTGSTNNGNGIAYISLGGILLLALLLRLYGIHWGLPDESHPLYSYDPDEVWALFAAEWLATGDIILKHFMYGGTVYFAILNAISHIAEMLQDVLGGGNLLADTILLGRYVLVGIALVTIILTYHVGRLLFDRSAGYLAALFLAIAPAHVVWAQRLRPDEIATFLTVIILYLSAKILHGKPDNLRYFIYVGAVLGVAVSLRFPLAVFASAPLAALLLASSETSAAKRLRALFDRKVVVMGLCTSVVYVLTSPQILMYPEMFVAGLEIQWRYQSGVFPSAVEMGPGIYLYGWHMLHQALGYALYALAALGILYALFRRTVADWLLLAAIGSYFVLTSFASWVMVRYTLPLVPLLAILAARVARQYLSAWHPYRAAGYAMIALIVGWTLLGDAAYLKLEAGKNVRELATEWIDRHVPHGSSIVAVKTYKEDDFFNPVIPKHYAYHYFPLVERGDGTELFREQRYDYLILHEYHYKDMERLGSRHPLTQSRLFYEALVNSRYRLIKEFKQPASFLGIDFSGSFSSNDYTVVNPGIRVYQYQ